LKWKLKIRKSSVELNNEYRVKNESNSRSKYIDDSIRHDFGKADWGDSSVDRPIKVDILNMDMSSKILTSNF
jgi:hypothetical protein